MKKLIPDCFWPEVNNGAYVSHEAICILNTNDKDVTVTLTLYFENRDKLGGYSVVVPAERTKHIRMDALLNADGVAVPRATPYAVVVESDLEVGVQYTRVDTTQAELAIASTII